MDALDHGKIVLGTIFAYRSRSALDHVLSRLEPDAFTDQVQRNLYVMAERYLDRNHAVLTRSAIEDGLRATAPGTALMYAEYFDALCLAAPEKSHDGIGQFRHSVDQLRELFAERRTGSAISTAMQILRQGHTEGRLLLQGHEEARSWLVRELSLIDRDLRQAEAPEGDIRHDGDEVLRLYAARKAKMLSGNTDAVSTGIGELDKILGTGLERGELDLVAGYTSSGKTSFCVQLAWHAAVEQGKNVLYFTSETLRAQVRIKILARHSRLEKFGLQWGLDSAEIKSGRLTPADEQALQAVIADFAQMQGCCNVVQLPRGSTVEAFEARLERITRERPADLVIVDYMQLLKSTERRRALWEESSAVVKDAKLVATGYRRGTGVPVVSPWQVSRAGRDEARKRGFYQKGDLAETAEAENSCDILLSLLEPADYTGGRQVTLDLSVLKNRDGAAAFGKDKNISVEADYATSLFTAKGGNTSQALLDMPMTSDPFGEV